MLFQPTGLGQSVVAVPSQCDRAGLNGLTGWVGQYPLVLERIGLVGSWDGRCSKIAAILLLGSAVASWPSAAAQNAALIGVAV